MVLPIHLAANQPADRFYRGGDKIRHFRSPSAAPAAGHRVPEDWVGSSTALFGESELGQTTLPTGELLSAAVGNDPLGWLGADHVAAFGIDTMLLVKLLDAGQRLPVHIHPSNEFAAEHLNTAHGKAEAWYILTPGVVHIGFTRDVSDEELAGWVSSQDVAGMLSAMHTIEVAAGDSVYVPPGMPHAIGEGIFLVEVQQPADLSILLEWKDFAIDGPASGHLGLGFSLALTATDTRGWSPEKIDTLLVRSGAGDHTLASDATHYFRAERFDLSGATEFEAGFGVLIVLEGEGTLHMVDASVALTRGDTVLVPHGGGAFTITGTVSIVRCQPPRS